MTVPWIAKFGQRNTIRAIAIYCIMANFLFTKKKSPKRVACVQKDMERRLVIFSTCFALNLFFFSLMVPKKC